MLMKYCQDALNMTKTIKTYSNAWKPLRQQEKRPWESKNWSHPSGVQLMKESTQSDSLTDLLSHHSQVPSQFGLKLCSRVGVLLLILGVVLIEVNGDGLVEFQRTGHSIGSLGTTDHLLFTSIPPVLTFSINRCHLSSESSLLRVPLTHRHALLQEPFDYYFNSRLFVCDEIHWYNA